LPLEYIKAVADSVHSYGGLFVLDCIASGTLWINVETAGVDVLISAPQKGWSGPACCGLVILNNNGYEAIQKTTSTSFSLNLKKWLEVMEKYESGSFMYHTTLPTDSLAAFRDSALETEKFGFQNSQEAMWKLGNRVREELEKRGFQSVAAEGFKAPGVVVVHSKFPDMVPRFAGQGLQIAAGVPFKIDEPEGLVTFRIGLFGLDKIADIEKTVKNLTDALDRIIAKL